MLARVVRLVLLVKKPFQECDDKQNVQLPSLSFSLLIVHALCNKSSRAFLESVYDPSWSCLCLSTPTAPGRTGHMRNGRFDGSLRS